MQFSDFFEVRQKLIQFSAAGSATDSFGTALALELSTLKVAARRAGRVFCEGGQDNGLAYIQGFAWFYYRNVPAQHFVQGRDPLDPAKELETGLKFTTEHTSER
jgi:hypothetical protein